MSAIGSAAAAAELAFIPYAESVLELMKIFMVFSKDEDLRARARATELVGIIAMAVGRPRMEPILAPFIEAAIAGFALDFSELREYTHGFFSNIAEVLDDGFIQYLHQVVPLAFASCNLDDGSAVDIDDSDDDGAARVFGVYLLMKKPKMIGEFATSALEREYWMRKQLPLKLLVCLHFTRRVHLHPILRRLLRF